MLHIQYPAVEYDPLAKVHRSLTDKAILEAGTISNAKETAGNIAGVGAVVQPKKLLWDRVKVELDHYWDGTKLLGKEIKISTLLASRLLSGNTLTRREQQQFLLPVALKLFPNMLPSTFENALAEEEKRRKLFMMRLEVAKFLQETIEESGGIFFRSQCPQTKKEFSDFFRKVRTSREQTLTEELLRVAKLFPDEIVLDGLSRPQLVSMCRFLNLSALGTDNLLKYQIRNRMNWIKRDDKLIMAEGVESLTTTELHGACQIRGIHTTEVSTSRLCSELAQWLDLSLKYSIPSSLLFLSRAFSFSDTTATEAHAVSTPAETLLAALASLPDSLLNDAELLVLKQEGAATEKQKLEVLKGQEELIAYEKVEEKKEEARNESAIPQYTAPAATAISSGFKAITSSVYVASPTTHGVNEEHAQLLNRQLLELQSAFSAMSLRSDSLLEAREESNELKEEDLLKYIEVNSSVAHIPQRAH
ncbi:hypothetical protein BGZ99_007390 [Dissophora globulifera]|uniref:Letm1 RBD domain-containing protein n=1 Tax=Dissophora globulifera TaxID=979702 RepID=A0A9P6UZK4_9FUNG|nr:hypothetical protein BGZ99_007390 [Dissophora globulifera]